MNIEYKPCDITSADVINTDYLSILEMIEDVLNLAPEMGKVSIELHKLKTIAVFNIVVESRERRQTSTGNTLLEALKRMLEAQK